MSYSTRLGSWTRSDAMEHAHNTVVVLPIGALEQHGPHLPLGTDTLISEHIAVSAVDSISNQGRFVVSPSFSYGRSRHHLAYGGTASIGTINLLNVLVDVVESFLVSGFAGVFILNGHGGNQDVVDLVVRDVALSSGKRLAGGSYYEIARSSLHDSELPLDWFVPGHAGGFETALTLAIEPSLVRSDLMAAPDVGSTRRAGTGDYLTGAPGPFREPDGFSDDPHGATIRIGQDIYDRCVGSVSKALLDYHDEVARRST